jgi:thiol-disulfide isomerase/thioredoxin
VLSDEQLIDQIRSELHEELSDLHPSAALPGGVWPQARATGHGPSKGVRRWRAGGRSLAFAISTVATVTVAALAIVLLAHGRNSRAGRPDPGAGLAAIGRTHQWGLGSAAALRSELRALRGHPIVIMAWATWCSPCLHQLPAFASIPARYRHRVAFLGVDINDAPNIAKSYLAKHPVQFANYRATLNQLQSVLRVRVIGLPTTFFISSTGKLVHAHAGEYYVASQALRRDVETLLR